MSTRRAKRHESDVFIDVKARKFWKKFDQEGLMHKDIREFADRPCKFRKRAYHRAKEIENKSLKTEPLGLLRFVKAPFNPDPFEPYWTQKEDEHD
ncbi:hypothetical protein ACLOBS_06885 [Limosilactobacillus mucosae]|uniref:hypothetical protein n=1 Tax=Limosilactobacillus mucosae TaxID=97478 RepID=UPI003EB75341